MSMSAISYTAEEWLNLDFRTNQSQIVAGTPEQPIIRVGTKNVIEAPEKSFKTTFMLRFALGLSSGKTVYPLLPVPKKRKVLYLHGELAPAEIQERTRAASAGLFRPLDNLVECRDISMHFMQSPGREAITEAISKHQPDSVVFDPWQAFIPGEDENQFKDVSEALHFIDGLIDKFKITVFLVTHVGKDHKRGTRGSSCIAGWRDTLIKLERAKKSGTLKVTVDPRWAAPLEPFHLKFDKGTLWPMEHFTGHTERIRHYVEQQGGSVNKQAIQDALQFSSVEAFRKALERAEKAGAIVRNGELVTLTGLEKPNGQPHRVGVCPSVSDALDKLSPPTGTSTDTRVCA
jgi:RecA-family ATPase